MAKVCVASHHGSLGELRNDSEFIEIGRRNDCLIELRLDQYSDLSSANLESTLHSFLPANLLVTHRSPEEGGRNSNADATQRFYYLSQATTLGAAYVDVELETLRRAPEPWRMLQAARQHGTQFVVSFHDFEACPPLAQLRSLRREAEEAGADVVKFAISAATVFDSLPLLQLLCETGWKKPFLGLAMGEAGLWSRVLGPRFPTPAPFTFARGGRAPGTAPGQPTWRTLVDGYRFPQLQSNWPVYGLMGDAVEQSLLPAMYNAALAASRLPGLFLPFRVSGNKSLFLRAFAAGLGLRGLRLTSLEDLSATPDGRSVLLNESQADQEARAVGQTSRKASSKAAPEEPDSAISISCSVGCDETGTMSEPAGDDLVAFAHQEEERFRHLVGQTAPKAVMLQVLKAQVAKRVAGGVSGR